MKKFLLLSLGLCLVALFTQDSWAIPLGGAGHANGAEVNGDLNVTGDITTTTGALVGNASTSTALAANGANCAAGNYPLGVDASGAVEDCTAAGGLSVSGAEGDVQYNDGASGLAAEAAFNYDAATDSLTVDGFVSGGAVHSSSTYSIDGEEILELKGDVPSTTRGTLCAYNACNADTGYYAGNLSAGNLCLGEDACSVPPGYETTTSTLGIGSVFVGDSAGKVTTTVGSGITGFISFATCVGIGACSTFTASSGSSYRATCIGRNACSGNAWLTADNITAVGGEALSSVTSGDALTSIGAYSLYDTTTGSNNIGIGYYVEATSATSSDELMLGYNCSGASCTIYGNTSTDDVAIGGDLAFGSQLADGVDPVLTADGVTNTGTLTFMEDENSFEFSGSIVHAPSIDTALLTAASLTVTKGIMRVAGDSGAVVLTSTPHIVDAVDGTCVRLEGQSDTNLLTFQDESNLALSGMKLSGGNNLILGIYDTWYGCYDSGADLWIEYTRSDN